ncbi:hypothetical protein Pst134EB_014731 [Puccinia striiformis f. sp. tritici]|nr:hypothetical protein Pst134EB_014731 [Puccinia striiformis f. sp. tritici]
MSTRNSKQPLLPLSDPERIIRSANAEQRRLAQLNSPSISANSVVFPTPSNPVPLMSDNPPIAGDTTNTTADPPNKEPSSSVPASAMSTDDTLRAFIKVQHAIALQSASRLERLETALLKMTIKAEPREASTAVEPGRINLQRFKTTDGPLFNGPFQSVEPFITWMNGVQIFFANKAVWHPVDKIRIIGCLIREANTLAFYASGVDSFVTKSWDEFKTALFDFALPPLWRTEIRTQIQYLKIWDSELFIAFSTRARTLQTMANFDAGTNPSVNDVDLAESVTLGLPIEVRNLITDHQVLQASPFTYGSFESRVAGFHEGLRRLRAVRARSAAPATQCSGQSSKGLPLEDTIWRIHSFLDSEGRCHFCKKTCGSPPATKRPTQPPAGRPSDRSASVAGAAEHTDYSFMDTASIQAMAALNEELRLTNEASTQHDH